MVSIERKRRQISPAPDTFISELSKRLLWGGVYIGAGQKYQQTYDYRDGVFTLKFTTQFILTGKSS